MVSTHDIQFPSHLFGPDTIWRNCPLATLEDLERMTNQLRQLEKRIDHMQRQMDDMQVQITALTIDKLSTVAHIMQQEANWSDTANHSRTKWGGWTYFNYPNDYPYAIFKPSIPDLVALCKGTVAIRSNGKAVMVRFIPIRDVGRKRVFKGKASCNKCDIFNMHVGTQLALARAMRHYMKYLSAHWEESLNAFEDKSYSTYKATK